MQYRTLKNGTKISALGYGCMRFTTVGGKVDLKKAEREIMAAVKCGINYFDTAYVYSGNEAALGKILEKNGCREKIMIADKLPYYLIHSSAGIEKYFQESLARLRTNYIDCYLMHMLSDIQSWERMKALGIIEWIERKKEEGAIRQIGFSFHGDTDTFIKLLNAYDWDFCQIQYNYLDEHTQAGKRGLRYAASKGIPVIIMEPLRGGRLVSNLPASARKLIANYPVRRSPAEWGLRWLWNQKEVTCVLSGMNSLAMLKENVKTVSTAPAGSLTESDQALIRSIRTEIRKHAKVGCTGCRYCMPCPQGVDIPAAFSCYNKAFLEKKNAARREYFQVTSFKKNRSDMTKCIGCGRCERHCPQHIQIRKELKNAQRILMPLPVRAVMTAANFIANLDFHQK
ncbi:MAG: aldo/keto reductase [Oscillospiraceae bacterium]|nr:aldo/keto reductase [Oscillospiraceae bacterium]